TDVLLGTFSDTALSGSARDITIDWGDGTAKTAYTLHSPGGLGSNGGTTEPHTFTEEGTYKITVTRQSYALPLAYSIFWVGVSDPPVDAMGKDFSQMPNQEVDKTVATFTDPGGA